MYRISLAKLFSFPALLFLLTLASSSVASSVTQLKRMEDSLTFIGEVKSRSYIKLELQPVKLVSDFDSDDNQQLKYKGTYYESASGRKYVVTAVFDADSRSWTFRCFNKENQLVFVFSGKQKQDGNIEGTWKGKAEKHSFYLRPA